MNPSSTPMSDEQEDELDKILDNFGLEYEQCFGDKRQVRLQDAYQNAKLAVAQHTKEAVARAKAEARKAAFDKIFEMAPRGNFEHWIKQMTANWFIELGHMERELSAPQQSKEDK